MNFRDHCPSFVFVRRSKRTAARTGEDFSFRQARQLDEREVRVWTLNWIDVNHDVLRDLERQWLEAAGPVLAMSWQPPDEASPIQVRFVGDGFGFTTSRFRAGSCRLELEEVL